MKSINSILIANRGEIASRVIRTCKKMGIKSIAVFSDADRDAPFVEQADVAVHIGESTPAQSYLDQDKIIATAKKTGADAIHPGYGFLSENADFAQSVIDAGLIWVGPKPHSISAMGLKDAAKILMQEAGVPVTPGYIGDNQEPQYLAKQADKIGYPVLIKAIAGGGGKGMRKVDNPADFADSLTSCQREAKASFGNDIVLIEKWIESPRHIEVQIFGDSHGNVVHLFERDCSLQRRHQKVIEEAPAPGMDEATREAVCGAAVRAAQAVDYEGAGTVEFIADGSDGLKADKIWFMEMNTRLQVEHPVTEEITGVDLVEWQLRVASGEALPLKQDELSINGHAIEARLYAEDPAKGFLPSTGRLELFVLPSKYDCERVDTGIEDGGVVSPFYDPMIAKLIASGDDRDDAIQNLHEMLADTFIHPIKTNAGFLFECLASKGFRTGAITTAFIEQHGDELLPDTTPPEGALRYGLNGELKLSLNEMSDDFPGPDTHTLLGFRLNHAPRLQANFSTSGETVSLSATSYSGHGDIREHGSTWTLGDARVVNWRGQSFFLSRRFDNAGTASAADGAILAPMPGKVIAVDVTEGQAVKSGDRLMVLEAMKMEHALIAPFDGTVTELAASQDGQVQVEAVLCVVEPVA